MPESTECSALICGAGPSGLAAALMLKDRGWRNIVLVEKRPSPDQFERSKSFNYQLDGRGQRLLERLGFEASTLKRYGLPNDHFKLINFSPEGKTKTVVPPILVPDRKTPYWMTRNKLLAMLQEEVARINTAGDIRLLYGHRFSHLESGTAGEATAVLEDAEGNRLNLRPQLVLGCDGLWSRVRAALADRSGSPEDFHMHQYPSPSTGLTYKVLNLPSTFTVRGTTQAVDNHELAYAFESTYKEPGRKMALFALPTALPEDPRSANIILKPDHQLWRLDGVEAVTRFLVEGFPQLDIEQLLGEQELKEFAELKPGQFPAPQYTKKIYGALDQQGHQHGLLLGDAAHAFPPDLGLGVNSALEDLAEFEQHLDSANNQLGDACRQYEAERIAQSAALVKLVQQVHPYQYGQDPLRLKLWMMGFLLQLSLHKISRGLVEMPGFMLSQKHRMPFTEILTRFRRGRRTVYGIGAALLLGGVWLLA